MFVRKFIILLSLIAVASCTSYKPVVDHRGSEEGVPKRYDDDLSSCTKLAEQTVPDVEHNIEKVLILPQETERALIIKKCLTGRGWSVVR